MADAQRVIAAATRPLDVVRAPAASALGLVLADDVVAAEAVPPFPNSAVDGFAVRAADTRGLPAELRVVATLPAGSPPTATVGVGEAARIMTGAPVPGGADAVVMVEDTESTGDLVRVARPADVGDHVRAAGSDLAAGDRALPAGTVVGAAHLGVLASLDASEVTVVRRPRVGVLSTGAELVERGRLRPGQIRDANRPMLLALAHGTGAVAIDLGIGPDDEEGVASIVAGACTTCDVVITSGGVSVGDYDHVHAVLARLSTGPAHWWQVAIKPAKPLAFAVLDDTLVFGLPGNPVSSLVSFEIFARPAILGRMGRRHRHRPEVEAIAADDMPRRPDGKLHLDRVILSSDEAGRLLASPAGAQASNVLSATALANGLALVPDGDGVLAGDRVRVMRLDAPPDH